MNLAIRDVRQDLGRFLLTVVGLGLLLSIVLAMTGIYNGLVLDATTLPDTLDADLWIVQRDTRGPFAEASRVSPELEERSRVVPGVQRARAYLTHTIQKQRRDGSKLRFTAIGLAWPDDRGERLPIVEGRSIRDAHFEMLADRSLRLEIGERLALGRDVYTVVGLMSGMVSSGGDAAAFFTRSDVERIQNDTANEAIRIEREARVGRVRASDLARDPELLRRARAVGVARPALGPPPVAAILVDLMPGANLQAVRAAFGAWSDVTVYTAEEERDFLLHGVVEKPRQQLGLFRVLLVVISAIVMGLIIYTMTVDKLHSIALLKLLGARTSVILGMILQESLLLGVLAYGVALAVGAMSFEHFPRRIVLHHEHRLALLGVVVAISSLASAMGIWKAVKADANQILAG